MKRDKRYPVPVYLTKCRQCREYWEVSRWIAAKILAQGCGQCVTGTRNQNGGRKPMRWRDEAIKYGRQQRVG